MKKKVEEVWSLLDIQEKKTFLETLQRVQDELLNGAECQSVTTCPKYVMRKSNNESLVVKLQTMLLYDECRICSIIEEFRPSEKFRPKPGLSYCPCTIFGREESMKRLDIVIKRIYDSIFTMSNIQEAQKYFEEFLEAVYNNRADTNNHCPFLPVVDKDEKRNYDEEDRRYKLRDIIDEQMIQQRQYLGIIPKNQCYACCFIDELYEEMKKTKIGCPCRVLGCEKAIKLLGKAVKRWNKTPEKE